MTLEEARKRLRGILTEAVEFENSVCYVTEEDREPLEMAIKALEQEPFINKPCVSSGVCEHDKNKILDKIRSEIKTKYDSIPWRNNDYDDGWIEALEWVLDDVIDKYKAESEE